MAETERLMSSLRAQVQALQLVMRTLEHDAADGVLGYLQLRDVIQELEELERLSALHGPGRHLRAAWLN